MNSRVTSSLLLQLRRHRNSAPYSSTAFSSDGVIACRFGTFGRCSFLRVGAWDRPFSSASPQLAKAETAEEGEKSVAETVKREVGSRPATGTVVSSYWGIMPSKTTREDGTVWPWNSFPPSDAYTADVTIDLSNHHVPRTKLAYRTRRYGCHDMMLETVAAVPGMVGGMLLHLQSLRRFEHSGGWIKALLEEAENERMHLMTMVEIVEPKWYERLLVLAVQGVFFNAYLVLYLLSPNLAHRFVGYLEEEAVYSYTEYLEAIESGAVPDVPAPAIAIDYWRLPKDARPKEVVLVIRADKPTIAISITLLP